MLVLFSGKGDGMRRAKLIGTLLIAMSLASACGLAGPVSLGGQARLRTQAPVNDLQTARAKIKHVVIIMQENRSFDNYFGTYPGADGIPMQNGVPTVCADDPVTGQCIKPFHDSND